MAKNEFQNSPHVLKTRYIMCWWHLNYILRHSEHLWIFTTSFREKIRKVDLNLDLNRKSWFKSKKSLIWIFLKKIRFFPTLIITHNELKTELSRKKSKKAQVGAARTAQNFKVYFSWKSSVLGFEKTNGIVGILYVIYYVSRLWIVFSKTAKGLGFQCWIVEFRWFRWSW